EIGYRANALSRKIILRGWAQALVEQERFDDAEEKYRDALAIAPDDEDTYYGYADLADQLIGAKRFDDAERLYQESLEFGERNKAVNRRIVLRRWGDALSRRKQFPEAAAKYHEALNLESGDEETHRGFRELGNALRSELRFNEAIEQYRIADQLYEAAKSVDRINLLQDWGDALLEQDSPIEAKTKIRRSPRLRSG